MASILNGTSGHMQFAPLSTEQTQSMCKHLQDHILQVESRVDYLENEKRSLTDKSTGIWAALQKESCRIDRLREDLSEAQGDLASQKKGLSSTNSSVHKLQTGLEQSSQNMSLLRDAQRRMDELLSHTVQSLGHNDKKTAQLCEMLDKHVNPEVAKLHDDLASTNFNVSRLMEAVEALKANSHTQLEQIRAVHGKAQATEDGLAKTDNRAEALQQQFAELSRAVRDMQRAMDGTKGAVAKLKELQERGAAQLADVSAVTKKNSSDIGKNTETLEQMGNTVQNIKVQLSKAMSDIGATKKNVADMNGDLQRLKTSHTMASEEQDMLAKHVQQIEQNAMETRRGLCQTNAVVLPNLQMNSAVAAMHTDTYMPLSGRTSRGPSSFSGTKMAVPGAHSARTMDSLKWAA